MGVCYCTLKFPRGSQESLSRVPFPPIRRRLPALKGDVSTDHMGAFLANEELDSVVEEPRRMLGERRLALLDEVQGVGGALAEGAGVAAALLAAVGVHTVHQAICSGGDRKGAEQKSTGRGLGSRAKGRSWACTKMQKRPQ